jgi:hypothetical protein
VAEDSEVDTITQAEADSGEAPPTVCPMCGASVPEEAIECLNCGEPFSPEAFESRETEEEKKSKWLFWFGLTLALIGGPGVALGSYLHDLLQIPIADYDNFDSFGWANQLVAVVGIVILVIGIILLILSLPSIKSKKVKRDEESTNPES